MSRQGIFRQSDKHVAVAYIRLTSAVTIEPGKKLPAEIRPFHLRTLFARRKIGVAKSEWAEQMIAACLNKEASVRPEVSDMKPASDSKPKAKAKKAKGSGNSEGNVVETKAVENNVDSEVNSVTGDNTTTPKEPVVNAGVAVPPNAE